MEQQRTHEHDCDACVYLGSLSPADDDSGIANVVLDLYYCANQNHPSLASLIARYGSEGHEYASTHPPEAFAAGSVQQEWTAELIRRARERGCYVEPVPRKEG